MLIDSMFEEENSHSETGVRTEHFLSKKSISHNDRNTHFHERLIKLLRDDKQTTSKRITALNILTSKNKIGSIALDELYRIEHVPPQTGILKSILQTRETETYDWLNKVAVSSREQEQLIQQILKGIAL